MDDWRHDYQVQTDYLRKQLTALRAGPRSRWRRFRLLEYVCRACGESVLEVMDLAPYRTVLTRHAEEHPAAPVPSEQYRTWRAAAGPSVRTGGWLFHPLAAAAAPDSARRLVPAACRCQARVLNEGMVFDDLASGARRRVLG